MVALPPGTKAPGFSLKALDGTQHDLSAALNQQPLVVAAFFKVSCPVCQLAFPYLERLHRSYPNLPIWGISQDDKDATEAFARMFGATFPMLLDAHLQQTVAYDLTNVPTVFLIGADRQIERTIVGFSKSELEQLNLELATASGRSSVPLFTAADEVPELKPG